MPFLKRFTHGLWLRLPQRKRRRWFIALFAAICPRPGNGNPPTRLPAVVGGVLGSTTGLGESARMNVEALRVAGLPFATVDFSSSLLGDQGRPQRRMADTADADGPGSLILHVSGPFIPYALHRCGRRLLRDKRVIGFWHWELPRLPAEWKVGMPYVHEVWVPSRFCAEAVRHDYSGPVAVVPHPVDVQGTAKAHRTDGVFSVVTMFNMASGFERKNPVASIRAFRQAFGRDGTARLTVKVLNPEAYPAGMAELRGAIEGCGNIAVRTEPMTRGEVLALIGGADAVLSLHRSEGFGLLAAEAMLIGVPVVATDWSATAEFVTAETGLPIPHRLIPAIDPQGSYHFPDQRWADPDVDAAAEALCRLRADPALASALAGRAKTKAADMFSAAHYIERIKAALGC